MECKVKIGVSYEPKWFERRYTHGTYSAKGVSHDSETIWIQQAMLGKPFKRYRWKLWTFVVVSMVGLFVSTYI